MDRDELISEISMRRDIPIDEVEDVLDEEELIYAELERKYKRKKRLIIFGTVLVFLAGAVATLLFLDYKEKVSIAELKGAIEENVKKYVDKVKNHE